MQHLQSITKIGRNPKNTSKVVSFLMPATFVLCLSIMYGGWSYIVHEQVSGRCVRQRYPICARNVVDISKLGDGPCNSEFDKIECGFDNGDCVTYNSMYPFCEVEDPWRVGDGHCDIIGGYNISECNWDGTDCISRNEEKEYVYNPPDDDEGLSPTGTATPQTLLPSSTPSLDSSEHTCFEQCNVNWIMPCQDACDPGRLFTICLENCY